MMKRIYQYLATFIFVRLPDPHAVAMNNQTAKIANLFSAVHMPFWNIPYRGPQVLAETCLVYAGNHDAD